MKLSTIVIVLAGAGVAFYAYKRYKASAASRPTAADVLGGTPLGGTILDPTTWGRG